MNKLLSLTLSAIFISACGGGGGGGGGASMTPSITISASSTSAPHYSFVDLSWSSTNTSSCAALSAAGNYWSEIGGTNQWTTKTGTSGSERVQIPYGSTTFVISCTTNNGNSITDSITINGYQAFNMASIVDFYDIYDLNGAQPFSTEFNGYMFVVNDDYSAGGEFADSLCVREIRINLKYINQNTARIENFVVLEDGDITMTNNPPPLTNDVRSFYMAPLYYSGWDGPGAEVSINSENSFITTNSLNTDYYQYINSPNFSPDNYDLNSTGNLRVDFEGDVSCLPDIDNLKLFMIPNSEIDEVDAGMVGYENQDNGFVIIYLQSEWYNYAHHQFQDNWDYYLGYNISINDQNELSWERNNFNLSSLNSGLLFTDLIPNLTPFPDVGFYIDALESSPVDKLSLTNSITKPNEFAFKKLYNYCNSAATDCSLANRLHIGLLMNPTDSCTDGSLQSCTPLGEYEIFFSFDESDEMISFKILNDANDRFNPNGQQFTRSISNMKFWLGF